MPQRKRISKLLVRIVFLAFLGWALALVRAVRPQDGWDEWSDADDDWTPPPFVEDDDADEEPTAAHARGTRRRLATSLVFATLFFAGAAFTAGAGDMVAQAFDPARCAALMQVTGETEDVCAEMLQDASAPAEEAAVEEIAPAAEPEAVPEAEAGALAAEQAESEPAPEAAPAADAEPSADAEPVAELPSADAEATAEPQSDPLVLEAEPQAVAKAAPNTRHWIVRRASESKAATPVVEDEGGAATVWLNRALPDPTPSAKRLSPAFAEKLQRISAVNGVSWALVLGVLRAEGARDRVPATVRELNALARGLRLRGAAESEWNAVLALSGRSTFADRAVALARYNRAVGLRSLVEGLEAAKPRLVAGLLADRRMQIYGAGRDDLQEGRIDVRVVVLMQYLAETYGQVSVSSLFSGHRKYARPGVVSAHIYGHAVDVTALGRTTIYGNSSPGGLTEKAVRAILMLPVEVQPRQVISLLGFGGPSFPLGDHSDHIHVGY